ncbi:MAG: hypothetical protein KJ709_08410 [Nanoarchaeota archaeon]|nr:hypothetical protein [Nanoarchaeota archaeon]
MNNINRLLPGNTKSIPKHSDVDNTEWLALSRSKATRQAAVNSINLELDRKVREYVSSRDFRRVVLSTGLKEKVFDYVNRYSTILSSKGLPSQELGMFLLAGDSPAVSDVYIPPQYVRPAYCEVEFGHDDAVRAEYGKDIISWAHSHGALGVFLSGEDKNTMRHIVPRETKGLATTIDFEWGCNRLSTTLREYPTVVVNNNKGIFCGKAWSYERYVMRDGKMDLEVTYSDDSLLDNLPVVEVEGEQPKSYDAETIDAELLSRVSIPVESGVAKRYTVYRKLKNMPDGVSRKVVSDSSLTDRLRRDWYERIGGREISR